MLFVLPLFFVCGLVFAALWWFVLRSAVQYDSALRAAKEREANFDRLLMTPDEPLHCLGCQTVFPGPLEEHGCPQCHVRAFVIPARAHSDPSIRPSAGCGDTPQAVATEPDPVVPAAVPSPGQSLEEASPVRQTQRK